MYMNHQPNVNTWKCHNPQWRVWGEFFAEGGKNIPFYCKISRTEDAMGSPSHQGQQALWGPWVLEDPGGCGCSGRCVLLSLSQVFSKHRKMQASESNYSPIKDKDLTWEGGGRRKYPLQERVWSHQGESWQMHHDKYLHGKSPEN